MSNKEAKVYERHFGGDAVVISNIGDFTFPIPIFYYFETRTIWTALPR